jgi:hypothetical protein
MRQKYYYGPQYNFLKTLTSLINMVSERRLKRRNLEKRNTGDSAERRSK